MTKSTPVSSGPTASGKSTDLRLPLEVATAPDDPDTKSFQQLEKDFAAEARGVFGELGKEVISSKINQHRLLGESQQDGGPGNIHDALKSLLDYAKIGMRDLARQTGVPRKRLLSMIEGRDSMPAEILEKIYTVVKKKQPNLFEFEKPGNC